MLPTTTMELLLKIPKEKDKPPVIAVVFPRVQHACETNADFIDLHSEKSFFLRFKKSGNQFLNFDLGSEQLQAFRTYTDVKFDADKLENFLYITRTKKEFLFIHLLRDFDQYFTVNSPKTMKKFELKVERVFLTEGLVTVK